MWFALEKVNRGVVADIPRFFGVFSWKRHKAHGELTEDSTILLPTRNSEEPNMIMNTNAVGCPIYFLHASHWQESA